MSNYKAYSFVRESLLAAPCCLLTRIAPRVVSDPADTEHRAALSVRTARGVCRGLGRENRKFKENVSVYKRNVQTDAKHHCEVSNLRTNWGFTAGLRLILNPDTSQ